MIRKLPQALQQNLLYALGLIIMKGVSFFMMPFVAHMLSPEDFGRLEVLNSLNALGSILVGFGLLNALFRYAGSAQDLKEKHQAVAEVIGINLILGSIALVTGLLFTQALDTLLPGALGSYSIGLMIGIIALEACIAIPLGWLRMNDRASVFFLLNTAKALIQAGLVVLFLKMGRGMEGVVEAGFISAGLLGLTLLWMQAKETGIQFRLRSSRTLLIYSVPLVGSALLNFVLNGLDRWLLAEHIGTADMALYAVAAKFAMMAALVLQPFLMWWSPRRFQVLNEANGQQAAAKFAALGSTLSLTIAVLVGLSAPVFIAVMMPESYWGASQYVIWLVLIVAIKDSAELLNLGCYTGNTTRAQFFINLAGSVFGLGGLLLWVPTWGIDGAIAALLGAQLVRLVLYLIVSQRRLPLPYPKGQLLLMTALSLSLLFIGQHTEGVYAKLAVAIIGTLSMLGTIYLSGLIPRQQKMAIA